MTLTLQRIAENITAPERVYFLMVRSNGHWSPGTKVLQIFTTQETAFAAAIQAKHRSPEQNFGVAVLQGEPREIANPIQMMQVEPLQ